jgi:hypothetical protein
MAKKDLYKTDKLNLNNLARDFGIAAATLKSNEELNTVLANLLNDMRVNKTEYTERDIIQKIQETNWFRTHLTSYLTTEKDRATKPEVFEGLKRAKATRIQEQYAASGAEIDNETALAMAEKLMYASGTDADGNMQIYDDTWLKDQITSAIDFTKTRKVGDFEFYDLSGAAEQTATSLYKMANDYGLDSSMSNKAFTSWFEASTKGLIDGTLQQEDVDDELINMAMSKFPGFAQQLQRGITLKDAVNPYMKTIADTLGYDETMIDLNDNLVKKVLNNVDAQGNFKPMSLYDAELEARRDDRFQYTETAKKEKTDIAAQILKDFGF